MITIKSVSDPSKIDSDRYWELVRRVLKDLFSKDPNTAAPLEHEIKNSSPDEQVLFYHSEPLSTATEIADKIPTQGQIDDYKKLRSKIYGIP